MEAKTPKILIVDDASNWRTTLGALLKSNGYEVAVAASAVGASEVLQNEPFAVAILDVRLNAFDDENNDGVTSILRSAHQQHPEMNFIVISSYYNETDVRNISPTDVKLFYFDKNNFPVDRFLNTLQELMQEKSAKMS